MLDASVEKSPTIDWLTVAAISAIAISFNVAFHEGIHALVCLLTGGKLLAYSALYVDCDSAGIWQAKLVSGSASIANLFLGTVSWFLLRRSPSASYRFKYFLWLFMLMNWVYGAGYWMFSGIGNVGDWASVIKGWQPNWLWRVVMALAGTLIYMWLVKISLRELGRLIGGQPGEQIRRARKLTFVSYFSAILVIALTGLLNPMGFFSLPVIAGLMAVAGATSPLLWMIPWFRSDAFPKSTKEPLEIHRSWGWVTIALVVVLLYVLILGPTIYFAQ
jgi:hypothetical protein